MIHYHGLPITPESAAVAAIGNGHAFLSFANPEQKALAFDACQSVALDNGAFPAWSANRPIQDWAPFYAWAAECLKEPNCDWAVIPDVIDGTEDENDRLVAEWPFPKWSGAPVWHMHEGLDRLARLVVAWPRVCLGSSGQFSSVGTTLWWQRMAQAMLFACDSAGRPYAKLHGLRMLNPKIFSRLPLSSADSTNIARNIGIDKSWKTGSYRPANKAGRAALMRNRIEASAAAPAWGGLSA